MSQTVFEGILLQKSILENVPIYRSSFNIILEFNFSLIQIIFAHPQEVLN